MKKIFSVLLVLGFILVCVSPAHAMLNRFTKDQQITFWTVSYQAGDTGSATGTQISVAPSSKVTAGRTRVLGYTITATMNNYEGYVGIYDNSSSLRSRAGATTALESEIELLTTDGSITVLFPYPYMVTEGLVVYQGANTSVTLYLEDTYGP